MQDVRYESPTTVAEAVELLSHTAETSALAGGTDLLVQNRLGIRQSEMFVDLKRIPQLMELDIGSKGASIGAAVPAAEIYEHLGVRAAYPGLSEAVDLIGSVQIQGRASLGGNLCNASPAADTVPSLIVLGASCVVAGPQGQSRASVSEFCTGPGQTILKKGELLVSVEIPAPQEGSSDAYLRFIPRTEMDIAVVGAAVRITLNSNGECVSADVSLGAVAATAILVPEAAEALVGTTIDQIALSRAGEAASNATKPIDDKRGTVAYRTKIAGVLTRRAAEIAASRAKERA